MASQGDVQESRLVRDGEEWLCILGHRKAVVERVRCEVKQGWRYRGMEMESILQLPTDEDFACWREGVNAVAFMTRKAGE
jgi:hypothetical protein